MNRTHFKISLAVAPPVQQTALIYINGRVIGQQNSIEEDAINNSDISTKIHDSEVGLNKPTKSWSARETDHGEEHEDCQHCKNRRWEGHPNLCVGLRKWAVMRKTTSGRPARNSGNNVWGEPSRKRKRQWKRTVFHISSSSTVPDTQYSRCA